MKALTMAFLSCWIVVALPAAGGETISAAEQARVVAEVSARAAELGVNVPVEVLAGLYFARVAWQEAGETCSATGSEACREAKEALLAVEGEFRARTGWEMADFKAGRVIQTPSPQILLPFPEPRTDPDHCVCSATIYSLNRWLNRYWALECNDHGGHGYCSSDLDWAHSPGQGAMTGRITVGFGGTVRSRQCPDDHRTCFKGPKPSKPNGGEWGNVCNCDLLHSQYTNPGGSWYGGDLTDAVLVNQGSFSNLIRDGRCNTAGSIQVSEAIDEHDPICCDDPMGTLSASATVANGTRTTDVPASFQNCNGGSQSGIAPNCGTFGATLRIVTTCQTVQDSAGSCSGRCGALLPESTCQCDSACKTYGDCCSDYCNLCTPGQLCTGPGGLN